MIEKGITFGNIHSFNDLNLILSLVEITPAEPKTNYVDIPGGDGSLDFTEAQGGVKFKDRTLTFTFTMRPDDPLTWEGKQTQVSNALNGLKCEIINDDEPTSYYTGRLTVNKYAADRKIRQIVVTARVHPYKYRTSPTVVNKVLSEEYLTIVLVNDGRKTVVPTITATGWATISGNGETVYITEAGTYKDPSLYLLSGSNHFAAKGSGIITFEWTEGDI